LTIRNSNLRTSLPACAASGIRRVPCTLRVCGRKKLPFAGYSVVKDHTLRAWPSAYLRPSLVEPKAPLRSCARSTSLAHSRGPKAPRHLLAKSFQRRGALSVTLSGRSGASGPPRRPAPLNAAP